MPAFATRNCRVTVSALDTNRALVPNSTINVLATNANVDVQSDEIDVTNFESGGFAEFLPSYVQANVSVDGFLERLGPPIATVGFAQPIIAAGSCTRINVFTHRGDDRSFYFPSAWILSVHFGGAVRDAARISFTARNLGSFWYPGGLIYSGMDLV